MVPANKKNKYYVLIILIISGFSHHIFGSEKLVLTGIVIDKNKYDTLVSVHVLINNRIIAVSDTDGIFSVNVFHGDILIFSHLGYLSDKIIITDSILNLSPPVIFSLELQSISIEEVIIFPFKDYSSFKTAILKKKPTTEQTNSRGNMALTRKHIIDGVIPEYDAEMNYRHDLRLHMKKKQPQGIVIFSSRDNRGINGLIKRRKSIR